MKVPKYQKDLSRHSPILLDKKYKRPKVEKMLAVLHHACVIGGKPAQLAIDIGCSSGLFMSALSPYFEYVFGLDIDTHALSLAKKENNKSNAMYLSADSMCLPFGACSVDLVICNHVYEHVPDAVKLFSEIDRVLKDGGVCYLGSASRLTVIEPHYHLPFLSWLPKPLAHWYMRICGKGDHYYEKLRTYWGIRKLISGFDTVDYTLKIVARPDQFKARDLLPKGGMLEKTPLILWKSIYWLLPSYIFILKKPKNRSTRKSA